MAYVLCWAVKLQECMRKKNNKKTELTSRQDQKRAVYLYVILISDQTQMSNHVCPQIRMYVISLAIKL